MKKKALTLIEVLISLAIGGVFLGGVLSIWHYTSRTWAEERLKNKLRYQLQKALERIKQEVRLSATAEMYFYPSGASVHEAVSFPRAVPDASGFLNIDFDEEDKPIIWDETVIHHVYDNPETGQKELRRTVFSPRDNSMSSSGRQTQLNSVVATGDGSSALNGTNATTGTIFSNLVTLTIIPHTAEFDGYSSTTELSSEISFGSISLTAGPHDFKFLVTGKNDASSGYGLGIDTIRLSPCGYSREGESYYPPKETGFGSSSIEDMYVYGGLWSGNRQLGFSASSTGDYITLSLDYDLLQECNFEDCLLDVGKIEELGDHNPVVEIPDREEGKYILWNVEAQTGASGPDSGLYQDFEHSIRTIISSSSITDTAQMVRVKFRGPPDHGYGLVTSVFSSNIAERLSDDDAEADAMTDLTFGGGGWTVIPEGTEQWSDWMEFTIQEEKDYLVSFWNSYPLPDTSYDIGATHWSAGSVNSYYKSDSLDHAGDATWEGSISDNGIYTVYEIEGWTGVGTVTSPIYDTRIADPVYTQISWTESQPGNTDVSFRVRSGDQDDMSDALEWDSIPSANNPAGSDISGIGRGRYVQFQATLASLSPYNNFPYIDDVKIEWQASTSLVEVSGRFSKRPDYGKFTLYVDDGPLAKGVEIRVTVEEEFRDKNYQVGLTTEAEPRN